VNQHISSLKGENAVKDWFRWSLRVDELLFFKVPSPIGSPSDHTDPKYKFPEGRLLSHFIINLVTPLLSLRAGTASENGYPKGLVALIIAALERAVRYLSKLSVKAKEFSKKFWGLVVQTYCKGFQGIQDRRWEELVDVCGGHSRDHEVETTREADLSILDNDRAFVFNFCSPTKS